MQDTPDKHTQIQQMDRIYQEAAFCIVAAVGMGANAGLPGVSGPRNARQRIGRRDAIGIQHDNDVAQPATQMRAAEFQRIAFAAPQ